jgi:hypothetical protein
MTDVAAVHRKPASTTRRTVRRLLVSLLAVTTVSGVAMIWVFTQVRDTADTVRTRTAPAILQLAIAHDALVQADNVAVTSFAAESGLRAPRLSGPGDEFRNQIAIASQSLTQVAGENTVGDAASRTLQLVQGLLVTYTALIEQADAHWQRDDKALGATELWSASQLLHGAEGILGQLDTLLDAQRAALAAQIGAGSMTRPASLALILLNLVLCALLVSTWWILRRRFRRSVNLGLVAACVLLVVGFAVSYQILSTQQQLRDSRGALDHLVSDRRTHSSNVDYDGQRTLAKLLHELCDAGGCGDTVAAFVTTTDQASRGPDVTESRLTDEAKRLTALIGTADGSGLSWLPVYPLPFAICLAVFLGLRPRLLEYRYQAR